MTLRKSKISKNKASVDEKSNGAKLNSSMTAMRSDLVPADKYKMERKLYKNLDENGWLKMAIKPEISNKTKKKPKVLDNCAIIGDLDIFLESIGCSKRDVPETRSGKSNVNSKFQSANKKDSVNVKNQSYTAIESDHNLLGNLTQDQNSLALPINNSFMNRIKQPACNYAMRMKASDSTSLAKTVENKNFGYKRDYSKKSPMPKSPKRLKKFSELKANKTLDLDTMAELDALIEADQAQNKFVDKKNHIGKIDFDKVANTTDSFNNAQKSPNKSFLQDICLDNKLQNSDAIELEEMMGSKKKDTVKGSLKIEGILNSQNIQDLNTSTNVLDITAANQSSNLQDSILQPSNLNNKKKSKKNTFIESKSLLVENSMLDTSLIDAKDNQKNVLEGLYEGYPKNGNVEKPGDAKKYTSKTILGADWLFDLHGISKDTDKENREKLNEKKSVEKRSNSVLRRNSVLDVSNGKISVGRSINECQNSELIESQKNSAKKLKGKDVPKMTKVIRKIDKKTPSSKEDFNASSFISENMQKLDPEMNSSKNLKSYFTIRSTSTGKTPEKNHTEKILDELDTEQITIKEKSVTVNSASTRNYGKLKRKAPEPEVQTTENANKKDSEKSFEVEIASKTNLNLPQVRRRKIKTDEMQAKQQKEDSVDIKKNKTTNKKSPVKKTQLKSATPSKSPIKKTPVAKNSPVKAPAKKTPQKSPSKKATTNNKKTTTNQTNVQAKNNTRNSKKNLEQELMNDIENFDKMYTKTNETPKKDENVVTSTKLSKNSKNIKKEKNTKSASKPIKSKK